MSISSLPIYLGYKMRTHLAKSLNTRCKAIENAAKAYNIAARAVDPPRPAIDWVTASHYSFLEDFELLRDTRQDIRQKPWVQPVARLALKQAQRITRAHEELDNCNIDVRRLHTHILDEEEDFASMIDELRQARDPILGAVEDYCTRRRRVNAQLFLRVRDIYAIDGFSGIASRGRRVGRSSVPLHERTINVPSNSAGDSDDDEDDWEDDDDMRAEYGGLVDYVADMPLR